MTEVALASPAQRAPVVPLPIVVDADVLLRNVDYSLRHSWTPRLLDSASPDYTLITGIVLFATTRVLEEVERHLYDISERRGIPYGHVVQLWNELFLPRIRWVDLKPTAMNDPRVTAVEERHTNDAPTAALAVALAPCVVLTDNRKHFLPLGLPNRSTDEIVIDAHALSKHLGATNAAVLLPAITGAAIVEGSKKVISIIGRDGALLVGLIALGAAIVCWRSEVGGRLRDSVKGAARELGPSVIEELNQTVELSHRVSALAIEPPPGPMPALAFIAKTLATSQTIMATPEIARRLRERGYRFSEAGRYETQVRAWLTNQDCFFEAQRGYWTLGYHAKERELAIASRQARS